MTKKKAADVKAAKTLGVLVAELMDAALTLGRDDRSKALVKLRDITAALQEVCKDLED